MNIDYRTDNIWKIYIHISPSDKYYVGITKRNVCERWRNGNGYKYNTHFDRAIKKYGWDNFEHFILAEHLTASEAEQMEITLIKTLQANNEHFGYNITAGGLGCKGLCGEKSPTYGRKLTLEQKRKISKQKKGIPINLSKEERKRKSDALKNKWKNQEYRLRMTGKNAPSYGRTGELHPMYGKTGVRNPNSKKVMCLDTNEIFASATEASKIKGVNLSKLCMCCRGERKSCGKDAFGNALHWKYI